MCFANRGARRHTRLVEFVGRNPLTVAWVRAVICLAIVVAAVT